MNKVDVIGKILFGLSVFIFGGFYVFYSKKLSFLGPAWLEDNADIYLLVEGIIFIVSALGIIFNIKQKGATGLLAITLLVHILLVYLPNLTNMALIQNALLFGIKDLGMLGAALFLFHLEKEEKFR